MAAHELIVNGVRHSIDGPSDRNLLSVLREELGLTGTKYGCGEGQCGACTVLLDGRPARSCLLELGSLARKAVTTIEGVSKDGRLHPLQEAFLEAGAMQCGYCTAGMIVAGVALLESHKDPAEAEIARALEGNVCRCGTYPRIVAAVRAAAKARGGTSRG